MRLSVVVIARNEAAHIGRALESALAALQGYDGEVILVDSASTDATLGVAGRYPVRVISLRPGSFLSPAAGRHVGLLASSGDCVFFLDGDSELEAGFFSAALPIFAVEPGVAAVLGRRREVTGLSEGRTQVACEDAYRITQARWWRPGEFIGGSGLYRAAALREVGGFNPWLCSCEEAELATRLFDAGHRLLFIPRPMISHLDHHRLSVGELRRRWRENLLLGRGQVLRLHPFRRAHYRGLWRILGMLALWALLPPLAGAAAAAGKPLLLAWPALLGALYAAFALHARDLTKPGFYFLAWTLSSLKLIQGFLRRPPEPADYPLPPELAHLQGEAHERPADNHRLLAGRQTGPG
jgi:cellulose synthase/poly-beta-1,6-N-acetylglucosamine synthase-like glycosyltransferase